MKGSYKYTVGADPEVFVSKDGLNPIPVCDLVGGTKERPLPMSALAPHLIPTNEAYTEFKYQEDGVAYEFNIPPAITSQLFSDYIYRAKRASEYILASKGLTPLWTVANGSHRFKKFELTHPNANRSGCDPDISAYNELGELEKTPRAPFNVEDFNASRFVGGHVHLGYDKEMDLPEYILAAILDTYLYLPILHRDKQGERRQFYGKAGIYRSKSYGIEYRTMSNFWLHNDYYGWVGSQCFRILQDLHKNLDGFASVFCKLPHQDIRALIDKGVATSADKQKQADLLFNIVYLDSDRELNCTSCLTDWI